ILVSCRSPNPLPPGNSEPAAVSSAPLALIPAPYLLERMPGIFTLREGAALRVNTSNTDALNVASWFTQLAQRTRDVHVNLRPDAQTHLDDDRDDDINF